MTNIRYGDTYTGYNTVNFSCFLMNPIEFKIHCLNVEQYDDREQLYPMTWVKKLIHTEEDSSHVM